MKTIFVLVFFVVLLFVCTFKSVQESLTFDEKCPPVGEEGQIDCDFPDIEDSNVQRTTCEALRLHCQSELDKESAKSYFH